MMEDTHLSHVAAGLHSLQQIPELLYLTNISSANFHGNCISRIEALDKLTALTELNISSNALTSLQGLAKLSTLVSLNVASNRLQSVDGLQGLTCLHRINLAHNFITSLAAFVPWRGLEHSLEFLDLRENLISNVQELVIFGACQKLKDLWLEGNPICSAASYREAVAETLPQLERLDGRTLALQRCQQTGPVSSGIIPLPIPHQENPIVVIPPQLQPLGLSNSALPLQQLTGWGSQQTLAHTLTYPLAHPPAHPAYHASGEYANLGMENMPPYSSAPYSSAYSIHPCQGANPGMENVPKHVNHVMGDGPRHVDHVTGGQARAGAREDGRQGNKQGKSGELPGWGLGPGECAGNPMDGGRGQGSVGGGGRQQSQDRMRNGDAACDSACRDVASAGSPTAHKQVVYHEVACQSDMDGNALEGLCQEAEQARRDLEHVSRTLEEERAAAAEERRESAERVERVRREGAEAAAQVRQQANEALGQAWEELQHVEGLLTNAQQQADSALRREQAAAAKVSQLEEELHNMAAGREGLEHAHAAELARVCAEAEEKALRERATLVQEATQHLRQDLESALAQLETAKGEARAAQQAQSALAQTLQDSGADVAALRAAHLAEMDAAGSKILELETRLAAALEAEGRAKEGEADALRRVESLEHAQIVTKEQYAAQIDQLKDAHHTQAVQREAAVQELLAREVACREAAAAQHAQQLASLQEARDDLQRQLATTEAEFRIALQEGEQEAATQQAEVQRMSRAAEELRRALHAAVSRSKQQDNLLKELSEAGQRQKARMASLQAEHAALAARAAAHSPEQVEKLYSEVAHLRERVGQLSNLKERAAEDQRRRQDAEAEAADARREAAAAAARVAQAEAAAEGARQLAERAVEEERAAAERRVCEAEGASERRVCEAEGALREVQCQLRDVESELENARDAVKVKEAMVDSANDTVASLKAALASTHQALAEAEQAAKDAQRELSMRDAEDVDRHQTLRMELEAQESALEEMERALQGASTRAAEAEAKAAAAIKELEEKDAMLKYVGEEVQRVKDMFQEKEQRLAAERDSATRAGEAAAAEAAALRPRVSELEAKLTTLPLEVEAERAKARLALEAETRARADAETAGKRLRQVEGEMRALLTAMERQKAVSAAKVKQLASVVHDLQAPYVGNTY